MSRVSLRWLWIPVALVAVLGFMSLGCGDDNEAQKDAAADTLKVDAAQTDVAQTDTQQPPTDAIQQDVPLLPNPAGNIIITQLTPQQVPGMGIPDFNLTSVSAGWSPNEPPPVMDTPDSVLDDTVGGLGCVAKHYTFNGINDAGVPTIPAPTTENAGTVTVNGFTGGFVIGVTDAGVPGPVGEIPKPITCTRHQKFMGDAGTGLYEYICNAPGAAPVTSFLVPYNALAGTGDRLAIQYGGTGTEVRGFGPDGGLLPVAPFAEVTNLPASGV